MIATCATKRRRPRGATHACAYAVAAPPAIEEVARVTCPSCQGSRVWMAPQPGGNDRVQEDCPYRSGRGTIREGAEKRFDCRQCKRSTCLECPVYVEARARRDARFAHCSGVPL